MPAVVGATPSRLLLGMLRKVTPLKLPELLVKSFEPM